MNGQIHSTYIHRITLKASCLLILLSSWLLAGCEGNVDVPVTDAYVVAVVVPMTGDGKSHWQNTVDWAVQNIERAQLDCRHRVRLEVEMHDEDTEDIEALASSLAGREDVRCVIGPVNQDHLATMASDIRGKGKPLMAIAAGSTEVARQNTEKRDFFWAFTTTDISQCEVMIATAAQMGCRQFALISGSESLTAKTFDDWFAFQVTELGLTLSTEAFPTGSETAIICVPADAAEARRMLTDIDARMAALPDEEKPYIYLSNDVVHADFSDLHLSFEFFSVVPSVDPQSGFYTAYYAHTGTVLSSFEPQLYDALMLTAMAFAYDDTDLKKSLIAITSIEGPDLRAWSPENMRELFAGIEAGTLHRHITGASGNLRMDIDNHTCVTSSHFMLIYHTLAGDFVPLSYYSPRQNGQSSATLSDWKWQVTHIQDIESSFETRTYPPVHQRWAVIVAASEGFKNYRHQADALNTYQYLRSCGFSDDHILLVMADDIAQSPFNTHPGTVSIGIDSENLYHDIVIDHHLDGLGPQDILDCIASLPSDADDNIFIFWSGHGSPAGLSWGENDVITPPMVRSLVSDMQGRYRKMIWCIEACFSGVIGADIEGLPDVIVLTAANDHETSKAETYNSDMGIWMTNRYSIYLIESLKVQLHDPGDITIREMYYYLSTHTLGSHVSLYNATHYDDITEAGFREYIME